MKHLIAVFFLLFFYCSISCRKNSFSNDGVSLVFDSLPVIKNLVPLLDEVSGIADSKLNEGYLWVEEDSGNPSELNLVGHDGKLAKKIFIKGVMNRDWEDIALVNNELFIADIGDNNESHQNYSINIFPEPLLAVDTVKNVTTIYFQYPDGSHDAEAFLIDPVLKDIYIITKRDSPSKIYKINYPYNTTSINIATEIGSLSYSDVVSAALSPDGKEILVKTYLSTNYYQRNNGESINAALHRSPKMLVNIIEPQGEAVCFSVNNSGYYTLSEKNLSPNVALYFYPRK